MRLAARITSLLIVGILLLMIIAQFVMLKHENEEAENDMRRDATQLGTVICHIVEDMWELGGQTRARRALEEIDGLNEEVGVHIVYFDADPGTAEAPSNPNVRYEALRAVYSDHYRDTSGQECLFTYARLSVETRPAAIEISERMDHTKRNTTYIAMHAMTLIIATALLGAVMAVVAGSAWIGRPLRRLIDKTRRIGEGDLSGPLVLHRNDEFGELAMALNSMCEQLRLAQEKIDAEAKARIATLDQLRHADRLRTVGRLAAGIAHEVGTPLNVISGRAGLIGSGRLDEEETRKSATTIKTEADRIATIVRQLLDFARRNTPQRKSVDLPSLTRQTIELLQPIAEKRHSKVELARAPAQLAVHVDSGQVQQVLTNLIVNAVESMPDGGEVEVEIEQVMARQPDQVDAAETPCARITICDRGEGISPEILEQIFEPFFTTKQVGDGTGLGLSIAYGIVQEHGGWIDVTSEPGEGSCFAVFLPLEVAVCKDES